MSLNLRALENENNADSGTKLKTNVKNKDISIDTAAIPKKIGQGEDAKNSIIWTIITWSLIIPTAITFLHFVTLWAVYEKQLDYINQANIIREQILKTWGIFSPLITLALGYIYGSKTTKVAKRNKAKS